MRPQDVAHNVEDRRLLVETQMDVVKTKLATAWIIPLAFLLPSILLTLSLWRQISRYRRYKMPQYYDDETIRKMV